jgi:enoyl-[acyl-carrier protein] reductase III
MAKNGYDIAGVHLDRKAGLEHVGEIRKQIEAEGRRSIFFNINAADEEKRREVLNELGKDIAENGGTVAVLLHSLAFGALRPYFGEKPLTQKQMTMTLDVMAHSLVYWSQDLVEMKLMVEGGRIFSMTSSGSLRVFPAYGAVSAAKSALESHTRQLALEMAPFHITVNSLRGGVTETPAAKMIPESDILFREARKKNPYKRLTLPVDVAKAVAALSVPGTHWITGNVINVDGGEIVSA